MSPWTYPLLYRQPVQFFGWGRIMLCAKFLHAINDVLSIYHIQLPQFHRPKLVQAQQLKLVICKTSKIIINSIHYPSFDFIDGTHNVSRINHLTWYNAPIYRNGISLIYFTISTDRRLHLCPCMIPTQFHAIHYKWFDPIEMQGADEAS